MDANNSPRKKPVPNHRLRQEREQRGWTYKNVADKIELPDSHNVGRWERGVSFPTPRYRRELSRIFGKSLEELGLLNRPSDQDAFTEDTEPTEAFHPLPTSVTSFIGRKQD